MCQSGIVLLAYVDESYTKERYYIAALVVPEHSLIPLVRVLDSVIATAARAFPELAPTAELHGHDIVGGKGDWKPLQPKMRARIGVYRDATEAIAAQDLAIIVRGVHVPRLHRRYLFPDEPHSIVLSHLIERIDEYAEARGQLAMLIADEVAGQDQHRRSLWEYQRTRTRGYRSRQITRVADTIHFAPSSASRLLQAADLVAYLYRRRATHTETDARAERVNAALWAPLEPKVHHAGCWMP